MNMKGVISISRGDMQEGGSEIVLTVVDESGLEVCKVSMTPQNFALALTGLGNREVFDISLHSPVSRALLDHKEITRED